jgi:Ni,Fe-hydrogenase III large subunit
MHLADLSALAGDIAYLSGQSFFAAQRTLIINSSLAICGSRFGKRWLTPGGTNYGISKEQNRVLRATLKQVRDVVESTATAMFADTGVLSRFDATGVLKQSSARELGIVGMAARSAGLSRDARSAYPIPPYQDFEPILLPSGDVYSRARLRYLEISQSMTLIDEWLCSLPEVLPYIAKLKDIPANAIAVSIIEGWRGEIVHLVQTDADAQTSLYKVYDPSFHNWTALALAVRGNGVSDFPVCNKSFNLSYCGFDL